MRIGILTSHPGSYTVRRLKQVCVEREHKVRVLDTLRFAITMEQGDPRLIYGGTPLRRHDAIIPRVGASSAAHATAVIGQFEHLGVFTVAGSRAVSLARDKLRSLQVLSRHDIPIPRTVFVQDQKSVAEAIERVGEVPVVVKVLSGTQGVGVVLADTVKVAEAIIQALQVSGQNVLIQRFVAESRGRDIRALVVGGKVVGAMRRIAEGDEFRSNLHRGGTAEPVDLDEEYRRVAVKAAQVLGLRVAGVDMLESRDGPVVMEVNASPGLEGIEAATGVDVASLIVEHIEDEQLLPEFDLVQRLTLDSGWGVAEVQVTRRSELVGKTLAELALGEREVRVLNVQRASTTIPYPNGSTRLVKGDVLVCYGKQAVLKALVPKDRAGRRQVSRPRRPALTPTSDEPPAPADGQTGGGRVD